MPRKPTPQKAKTGPTLFLHKPTGQWTAKFNGKFIYFGKDLDTATRLYQEELPDRQAGHDPRARVQTASTTLADICNRFLTSKKALLQNGELSPRTFREYYDACENLVKVLGRDRSVIGLASNDFEKVRADLATRRGPVALGNEIQRVRTIFKYAFEDGLIDIPVRFGTQFRKPSRKTIRKARQASGGKMLEAEELRTILDNVDGQLKAMILLALNCGFGQTDVSGLPQSALDLKGGWVDYPRPKTAILRRCPLWPETVAALREAMAKRPKAMDEAEANLVFITKYGHAWVRVRERNLKEGQKKKEDGGAVVDSVGLEFNKVLNALALKRPGLGFYALRHIFRTIGDSCKDQPAVDHIMGHEKEQDMSVRYRERIDDGRLKAVTDIVRLWLWPSNG